MSRTSDEQLPKVDPKDQATWKAYQALGDTTQTIYREAIGRYLDSPNPTSRAERSLTDLEHALLVNPPAYQRSPGVWAVRRKGLVTVDQVRANATPEGLGALNELEMPIAPRIRDDFKLFPKREWMDALQEKKKQEALNRARVKFSLDQNGVGSCASEGIAGCTSFLEDKQGVDLLEILSPLALYRLVNGGRDGGSSLQDNVVAASKYGIPAQRVWPRSKSWRTPLSDEAKQDALNHRIREYWRVSDEEEMATALLLGMPVYAGYSGHAWFAVDLIDTNRFLWKNSWGEGWGDHGFGTLRFSSVAWYYGLWAFRTTTRPIPF